MSTSLAKGACLASAILMLYAERSLPATWSETEVLATETTSEPQLAAHGRRVYAVWGDGSYRSFLRLSGNRGRTWKAPIELSVVTRGKHALLAVTDSPNDRGAVIQLLWRGNLGGLWLARSFDGGRSWEARGAGGARGYLLDVGSDGAALHVVYYDQRGLWHQRTPDAGETWTAPVRIATDDPRDRDCDGYSLECSAAVTAAGDRVFVAFTVYRRERPSSTLHSAVSFSSSFDGGSTWVSRGVLSGSRSAIAPTITLWKKRLAVAWAQWGGRKREAVVRVSLDKGRSWSRERQIIDTVSSLYAVSISLNRRGLHFVARYEDTGYEDEAVIYLMSRNNGRSWQNAAVLTFDPDVEAGNPRVVATKKRIYAGWSKVDYPFCFRYRKNR